MGKNIFGHYCRKYGNEYTHLTLTEKAEKHYSESDPLSIWEREVDVEDEDGDIVGTEYRYTMTGMIETADIFGNRKWVTEDVVNDLLEESADALEEAED